MDVTHNGLPLAQARQTRLGLYATAREAFALWAADPEGVRILDVRAPQEYALVGHAPMSWLIPLAVLTSEWDPSGTALRWEPNPNFVPTVLRWAEPDDTILVTCRSGGRSAMAINALAAAGFTKLYNIIDGMEGGLVDDPSSVYHGMRMKNGWKNSGLPWTYELDPTRITLPVGE